MAPPAREPPVIALNVVLGGVLMGGYLAVVAVFVVRATAFLRRHYPIANRRFLHRYRGRSR